MSSAQMLRQGTQLTRSLLIFCPKCAALLPKKNSHLPKSLLHTTSALLRRKEQHIPSDYVVRETTTRPTAEKHLGELVYCGTLARQIAAAKIISLTSSGMGIALQPVLFEKMDQLPVILKGLVGSMLGFFIFVTPLMLFQLVKRYITRLYYDPETGIFTAVTMKFIPGLNTLISFTAKNVSVPPTPGMFTSFTVEQNGKKLPLFVNPPDFLNDKAYVKLMRYDEPMDVLLGPQFGEEEKKKQQQKS